jgi:hypothetical protein
MPRSTCPRPFNRSGYEILDTRLESHGEVVIWSVHPTVPVVGDVFTLSPRGRIVDVTVVRLSEVIGGWIAYCTTSGRVAAPTSAAAT